VVYFCPRSHGCVGDLAAQVVHVALHALLHLDGESVGLGDLGIWGFGDLGI